MWKLLTMEKCIWSLGRAQHCTTVPPAAAGVLLQDAVSELVLDKWSCREVVRSLQAGHTVQRLSAHFSVSVLELSLPLSFIIVSVYVISVSCSSRGSRVMSHCIVWKSHCSFPLHCCVALLVTPLGPPLGQFSCVTDAV